MIRFTDIDLESMDFLYRINLINSCSGYKSANLIGTKSKLGEENVAVFSSITHIGSNPALLGFFLRPTTVSRNTYDNIKETGVFSINHIHEEILEDAHHTSAKYEKSISEFNFTKLIPEYKDNHFAPYVKEAPVQLCMSYVNEYPIEENGTLLIVGKINSIYVSNHILKEDGFINLSDAKIATINGLDGYAIPELKTRFKYQRPKK